MSESTESTASGTRAIAVKEVLPKDWREATQSLPGEWGDTYWSPPGRLSYEQYEELIGLVREKRIQARRQEDVLLWWLADMLNNAEMDIGDALYQLFDQKAYTKESLIKIRRVGEEFRREERFSPYPSKDAEGNDVEGVSFWTHWEVQRLDRPDRKRLLKRYATDPDYSRDDLRTDVRAILKARDEAEKGQKAEQQQMSYEESGAGDLVTCPLCHEGHVTPDQRDAYLKEEGLVGSVGSAR